MLEEVARFRVDEVRESFEAAGAPKTVVDADHNLISPAFNGLDVDIKALEWCIHPVKENPRWRLSLQQHKTWGVR